MRRARRDEVEAGDRPTHRRDDRGEHPAAVRRADGGGHRGRAEAHLHRCRRRDDGRPRRGDHQERLRQELRDAGGEELSNSLRFESEDWSAPFERNRNRNNQINVHVIGIHVQ